MKAAIISLGSKSSKMLAEEMRKLFTKLDEINITKVEVGLSGKDAQLLYDGEPLKSYDCVFAMGSFRYANLLRSVTTLLESRCYMPLKPDSFTIGHNKLLTHLRLQRHGIPMPGTYVAATIQAAKKILSRVNYPIIMKLPEGTQGKGVMFAESFAAASSMLDTLDTLKQPFIIQEYIETGGKDIRAIVVGSKVVASMERKASEDEKRANIHAGGIGKPIELDSHTKKVAVKAAQACDAEICAVDILESHKGPVVIEINLSPGLQGITKATKTNIAEKIAKYLYKETKKKLEKDKSEKATKIMKDISAEEKKETKHLITELDFRGNRILLPEFVSDITGFEKDEEYEIDMDKDELRIKKFKIKKEG